jgi:hypothetical protein
MSCAGGWKNAGGALSLSQVLKTAVPFPQGRQRSTLLQLEASGPADSFRFARARALSIQLGPRLGGRGKQE